MNTNLGLLGTKLGMTQFFDDEGNVQRVTVIQAGPCVVLGKRTPQRDGYSAVQLGYGRRKPSRTNRPLRGFFEKAGVQPTRFVREMRVPEALLEHFEVGQWLRVQDVFREGMHVDVTGRSKGRGFAGVIKRHGFHGAGSVTHGTHEYKRHGGSIGMCKDPGRVLPGKRMAGHYGDERITILNLRLVRIVEEDGLLMVRGAVPGPRSGLVIVRPAVKKGAVLPPFVEAKAEAAKAA